MTPWPGSMRIRLWRPATRPLALSITTKCSGSSPAAARSSHVWNAARLSGGVS
jgi:hypothetical protein